MDRKIHCSACLFYYAIADEFRDWLRDAKDMYLDDIAAYEAQELFAQFVDRWNAGRLHASYYSDRPRWCPTCEVMEKTLCTEAEACAALDVFDEETLAIEWIRLRRALSKLPRSPRDGSPRDVIREIGKWHPLLIPPFINDRLRRAVRKYLAGGDGKKRIVAKYGDISHWDVSQVTTICEGYERYVLRRKLLRPLAPCSLVPPILRLGLRIGMTSSTFFFGGRVPPPKL